MKNPVTWALDQVKRINELIWHTPLAELSKRKTFLIKQLRIIFLATRGFSNDKVQLRASALTFYTLLSIIPVLAIAFAIAKGFGLDQDLQVLITNEMMKHQLDPNWLLNILKSTLQETRGGYMAGIGVIILFWSVMSLLDRIESSFNHIWQVPSSRPWYRKFTDYLTIILIAPIFIVLSGSITVFAASTQFTDFMDKAPILAFFKPLISFLIRFAPYLLTWIILTVLFIIMPNAKVNFVPAMVSGIIIGTILQVLLWLYIDLQFGITKLSAIYGSFALVPLFIIFLQTTWTIVLLGAELSFANQNVSRYEFETEALNISNYQKRALVIMIMHLIIRNFAIGEKPISAESIGKKLIIPVRLARELLQDLSNVELVSIIHENEQKERLYQPAMDIHKLTVCYVLSRLDKKGISHRMVAKNKDYENIIAILEKFEKLMTKSDSNILIKDL
jgi:membrane protein